MNVTVALPVALVVSALAIRLSIPVAHRIGLIDKPGGHKQHECHVPLVGGLGIYSAVVLVVGFVALQEPGLQAFYGSLLIGTSLLFLVGLLDDIRPLSVRLRFGAQAFAGSVTALWGGILLQDFGALVSSEVLMLGVLALPITLFATAGVINALNMIDGVDGLSGSLSFVTLLLLAVVAYNGDAQPFLVIILALLGAVGGFLVFNLRCFGRPRARVFMGDAGSTLLGFLFACLFIGLSQGEGRSMSPVTALWLFSIPLFDTMAIMMRRIWLGRSPFGADRWHLHHLLLDSGFTVSQGVMLMSLLQLLLGGVGLVGWHYALPEWWMFAGFLGLFLVYLTLLGRPGRFVPHVRQIHRGLDLKVAGANGAFISNLPRDSAEETLRQLLAGYLDDYSYELYASQNQNTGRKATYAIVHIGCERTTPKVIRAIRRRLAEGGNVAIRQLVPRNERHDRRLSDRSGSREQRRRERRGGASRLLARHLPVSRIQDYEGALAEGSATQYP